MLAISNQSVNPPIVPVDVVGADVHVAGEGDAARPRLGHVQHVAVLTGMPLPCPAAGVAPAVSARTPEEEIVEE